MSDARQLSSFERLLSVVTKVEPGEGRCIAILCLQAFLLMVAYYLIRPVREALILTEGDAELRSYAVGVQALLLILIIPVYGLLVRRISPDRVFQRVNAFFALNLVVFFLLGQAGLKFGFVFFVWCSLFAVMTVTQFWAFATDLFSVKCGQRLFSVIAVGVSAGALTGSRLASAGFNSIGAHGLMLASAAVLAATIYISDWARRSVPAASRSTLKHDEHPAGRVGRLLGGFAVIGRSRYLVGIAALVMLLNWITSTGDYVLANWLVDVAREQAPQAQAAFIGRFMGNYGSAIALVGLLVQLLLVSRIILLAGLARALMVTPIAFLAGFLLIGVVPVFALLQSVLVLQKSLDYSLLNTTRSALLLPASREEKYQAKTAIDTFFYRSGDLLSTFSIFIGVRLFADARLHFVWLIVVLSATMMLVAWLIGREYSRRYGALRESSGCDALPGAVLTQ
ncbi:MAG: NTP/NDP exchange transporter [Steroidobacteraceae bacterium]